MIYQTIHLPVPGGDVDVTVYAPDNSPEIDPARTRPAVILCPGGGYHFRSDREAEPVALQLLAADCAVFLLHYAVAPARYPLALTQLAAAVAHVRAHGAAYHVQPDKVAVMGFSAGGHLAASLGVRWQEPWLAERLGVPAGALRPDGMILCYPVITGGSKTHQGSMENLTGSRDKAAWEAQSLEKLVSAQTPQAFLWHTFDDGSVPVENSLCFAAALREYGVTTELHIYPHGCHGLSLADEQSCNPVQRPELVQPDIQNWFSLATQWLKAL